MKNLSNIKEELQRVYSDGNWNSVRGFLKRNNIKHEIKTIEFGLSTNKKACEEKFNFIENAPNNEFRAHRYSLAVKSSKSGFSYNRIFAQSVILL